jgi:ABC-2 type transport system permease protein
MSGFLRRTRAMAVKEFRQSFRDRLTLAGYLFLPIFLLLLFGFALSFDVKHVPLAVWDQDKTRQSRDLAALFTSADAFDRVADLDDLSEADAAILQGKATAVLCIPRGYARDLAQQRTAQVGFLLDGADANQGAQALAFAQGLVRKADLDAKVRALARDGREFKAPVEVRQQVLYNPELETRIFMIPGLMVYILTITAVISTVIAVVRERERGTFEQLQVSPVRPAEVILGKLAPYLAISVFVGALVVGGAVGLFGMPLRGSLPALVSVLLLFLVTASAQGLFLSTLSDKQETAFSFAALLTMLPSVMLSGFIYPIRNMPVFLQAVTWLFPGRYLISALRALMLRDGTDILSVWREVAALCAYTTVVMAFALRRLGRILK